MVKNESKIGPGSSQSKLADILHVSQVNCQPPDGERRGGGIEGSRELGIGTRRIYILSDGAKRSTKQIMS